MGNLKFKSVRSQHARRITSAPVTTKKGPLSIVFTCLVTKEYKFGSPCEILYFLPCWIENPRLHTQSVAASASAASFSGSSSSYCRFNILKWTACTIILLSSSKSSIVMVNIFVSSEAAASSTFFSCSLINFFCTMMNFSNLLAFYSWTTDSSTSVDYSW